MGFLSWIVLGAIDGWIGSMIVNRNGEGRFRDVILGGRRILIKGRIFQSVGSTRLTGFNAWSLLVAVVGSVIVLMLYHAIARPHGPSHA